MARYKGHEGSFSAGGDVVTEVESFDINTSVNALDANIMGSDWTDVEAGQSSAEGSVSVLRDPDAAGQAAMVVGTSVAMLLYPESNTTGRTEISGNFMVLERATSVSVGDLVKDTFTIRNKGAVTVGTVS